MWASIPNNNRRRYENNGVAVLFLISTAAYYDPKAPKIRLPMHPACFRSVKSHVANLAIDDAVY